MKKILSILLCLCMVMALLPTMALAVSYQDYNITSHNLSHAQTVLSGVAEVTQDGENIVIKLTSDINGRLHIGVSNAFAPAVSGTFVLDLNGKTIDAGNELEAICLDNNVTGTFVITGNGTMKTGYNHIIYTWDATINFEVEDGYDYFTLKKDGNDYFSDEKNTATQSETWNIDGTELVMTQGNNVAAGTTYAYAYDTSRNPAFPASEGAEIELYGLNDPMMRDESTTASNGEWTLAEVGAYSEKSGFNPVPNSYLDGIVNSIALEYGLGDDGKNALVIHKLTDENDALVAYGVVIGVDESNNYVLFIGDIWGYSGAGYVLSMSEITADPITFRAGQMAQSNFSVSLDPATITFTSAEEGYAAPSAETITVANTGDTACGALNISLSGGASSAFTLSKSNIADIAVSGNDTFTVVPKTGLSAGTYSETITVNGDNIMPVTTTVSFIVTAPTPAPTPTPTSSGGSRKYIVKFETNGGSAVAAKRVSKNSNLAKPAEPVKEGFEFDGWYTDKELSTAYDFSKRVTNGFTLYAKWVAVEAEKEPEVENSSHDCVSEAFEDLDIEKWYHEDVDYVLENKIMLGTEENKFAPDESLTRAMLVTILYRTEGEPATNRSIPFADIDMGAYYANAVVWAQQSGIVNGVSESEFAPDNNVTREQLAAIMLRYAQLKGLDAVTMEENLHFEDASDISEYAVFAMNWGVGQKYIFSRTEGKISPKDAATRAEIAAFLHRFMENY